MQTSKETQVTEPTRPLGFYFLVLFLFFLVSFIGWNFGSTKGAIIGFICAAIVNTYALTIKND